MASYDNNLRIKEIATGAEAGSWGSSTNTNLSLIGDALGYATEATFDSDANKSVTVGDATVSPYRSIYVKVTSSATLSTARDLTIGPNSIKRVMFIENATTGGQSIVIKQGSGGSVTVPNGAVVCVYLDGAGAGAAVVSVFTDFVVQDSFKISGTTPTLTLGDGDAEDTKIVFDGNAKDFYVGLDDTSDKLVMGVGSTVGTNSILSLTDDTVTIGDGSAVDSKIVFDGNNQDFYIGLDDSEDDLIIGKDSTVGAQNMITITSNQVRQHSPSFIMLDGDIYLETASRGIVMRSPDNTEYKITVSNAGALVVTAT